MKGKYEKRKSLSTHLWSIFQAVVPPASWSSPQTSSFCESPLLGPSHCLTGNSALLAPLSVSSHSALVPVVPTASSCWSPAHGRQPAALHADHLAHRKCQALLLPYLYTVPPGAALVTWLLSDERKTLVSVFTSPDSRREAPHSQELFLGFHSNPTVAPGW